MPICKKCRRPLHPLSRYAAMGIGEECLRNSNDEVDGFLEEMNLEVPLTDREYANDLNTINDTEISNDKKTMEMLKTLPDTKLILDKMAQSKFFIADENEVDRYDDKFEKPMGSQDRAALYMSIVKQSGVDIALDISKNRSGISNEKIRKLGFKKWKAQKEAK